MDLSPVWRLAGRVVHKPRKIEKVSAESKKQAATRREIEDRRNAAEIKHEFDELDLNY